MTKQELLEKIKNDESVWVVDLKNKTITENKRHKHFKKLLATQRENRIPFDRIFTTRRQAEHYLHHANITRTETLPFLTWEEFLEETRLKFIACDGVSNMILYCCNNTIYLVDEEYPEFNTTSWELTEANFYKAYDECVRLFKGEV